MIFKVLNVDMIAERFESIGLFEIVSILVMTDNLFERAIDYSGPILHQFVLLGIDAPVHQDIFLNLLENFGHVLHQVISELFEFIDKLISCLCLKITIRSLFYLATPLLIPLQSAELIGT